MRVSSKCYSSILIGSMLALPAIGQQTNTNQQSTGGTQVVRTMDDLRERILLDRIEQLEKRLADLEARNASAPVPSAPAAATSAPAAPEPAAAAPPAQAPATAPETTPPTWSVGPIDFNGRVSAYYTLNGNHPASMTNQLYNFNVKANQFSLDMAEFNMSHTADPVGFELDLGFGRAFDIIAGSEQQPAIFRNIRQAYVSLKPPKAKGFEVDFGKFVTSAGAEVIETDTNWNYSHSLLFSWAIPYYHFGLRTSFPVGKHFTGGFQVVNGWNNVEDNNSGKTIGLTGALVMKKFSWFTNYYAGPENAATNSGWRNLFDTTLLLTPPGKLNAYINFDYAQNKMPTGILTATGKDTAKWYGIAGAFHVQATSKWAFTPRVEWFKDRDGFAIGGPAQDVKEFTFTGEYKMLEGFFGRAEYRRDWSNKPFFDRGLNLGVHKNQDTLSLGLLAFFGPKR